MSYYSSPAEMYTARADRYKRNGDYHWAMAKNGEGNFHYGKARHCYGISAENREKAAWAKAAGATFRSSRSR